MRSVCDIGYSFNGGMFIRGPFIQCGVDNSYNVYGIVSQTNTLHEAGSPLWFIPDLNHLMYGKM